MAAGRARQVRRGVAGHGGVHGGGAERLQRSGGAVWRTDTAEGAARERRTLREVNVSLIFW